MIQLKPRTKNNSKLMGITTQLMEATKKNHQRTETVQNCKCLSDALFSADRLKQITQVSITA
jgi:hypothetical protein